MSNIIKILDHGFVKLRNLSGPTRRPEGVKYTGRSWTAQTFDADDTDPANTARISFDNLDAGRAREEDLRLYEYLIKNHHNTPVEMIETWWEMKLPIFIARQFVRHRTACINEVSARYSILPMDYYVPKRFGKKGGNNKQGQQGYVCNGLQVLFKTLLHLSCLSSYTCYKLALLCKVAPEQARLFLHVNFYTHWVWKQDLSNLMHFLALRLDSHAQVEARVYAQAMYDLLNLYLPKSMEFFDKYKRL